MVSHIFYVRRLWFAWCQVFVSGKLIHAGYIRCCSIVEVVVDENNMVHLDTSFTIEM